MAESTVRIGLVLPDVMGTYGDGGNSVVMRQRLRLRGIDAESGDLGEPLDRVVVRREQVGHLLIELAQMILDHAQFFQRESEQSTVDRMQRRGRVEGLAQLLGCGAQARGGEHGDGGIVAVEADLLEIGIEVGQPVADLVDPPDEAARRHLHFRGDRLSHAAQRGGHPLRAVLGEDDQPAQARGAQHHLAGVVGEHHIAAADGPGLQDEDLVAVLVLEQRRRGIGAIEDEARPALDLVAADPHGAEGTAPAKSPFEGKAPRPPRAIIRLPAPLT